MALWPRVLAIRSRIIWETGVADFACDVETCLTTAKVRPERSWSSRDLGRTKPAEQNPPAPLYREIPLRICVQFGDCELTGLERVGREGSVVSLNFLRFSWTQNRGNDKNPVSSSPCPQLQSIARVVAVRDAVKHSPGLVEKSYE